MALDQRARRPSRERTRGPARASKYSGFTCKAGMIFSSNDCHVEHFSVSVPKEQAAEKYSRDRTRGPARASKYSGFTCKAGMIFSSNDCHVEHFSVSVPKEQAAEKYSRRYSPSVFD